MLFSRTAGWANVPAGSLIEIKVTMLPIQDATDQRESKLISQQQTTVKKTCRQVTSKFDRLELSLYTRFGARYWRSKFWLRDRSDVFIELNPG